MGNAKSSSTDCERGVARNESADGRHSETHEEPDRPIGRTDECLIPPFRCRVPTLRQFRRNPTQYLRANSIRVAATLETAASLDALQQPRNLRCSWGFKRMHRLPQHEEKPRTHHRVLSIRFFADTWRLRHRCVTDRGETRSHPAQPSQILAGDQYS